MVKEAGILESVFTVDIAQVRCYFLCITARQPWGFPEGVKVNDT